MSSTLRPASLKSAVLQKSGDTLLHLEAAGGQRAGLHRQKAEFQGSGLVANEERRSGSAAAPAVAAEPSKNLRRSNFLAHPNLPFVRRLARRLRVGAASIVMARAAATFLRPPGALTDRHRAGAFDRRWHVVNPSKSAAGIDGGPTPPDFATSGRAPELGARAAPARPPGQGAAPHPRRDDGGFPRGAGSSACCSRAASAAANCPIAHSSSWAPSWRGLRLDRLGADQPCEPSLDARHVAQGARRTRCGSVARRWAEAR